MTLEQMVGQERDRESKMLRALLDAHIEASAADDAKAWRETREALQEHIDYLVGLGFDVLYRRGRWYVR